MAISIRKADQVKRMKTFVKNYNGLDNQSEQWWITTKEILTLGEDVIITKSGMSLTEAWIICILTKWSPSEKPSRISDLKKLFLPQFKKSIDAIKASFNDSDINWSREVRDMTGASSF